MSPTPADVCDCGAAEEYVENAAGEVVGWLVGGLDRNEHLKSEAHLLGLMQAWTDRDWELFIAALDNGLAWADSEGMAHWFSDRDTIMAVAGKLIAEWRARRQ